MTTRLYFSESGAAAVSPAFDAAWTSTGSAIRRALRREYDGTALTDGTTLSWTSGDVALDRQYVSPPLAAQTLSGTVRMQLRAQEVASTDNAQPYLGIHVFSEDGTTYRATLLTVGYYSPVTELPTTQTNTTWTDSDTLTSYTCVDGDRIVVEIGYSDVAGTTPQALARWGAPTSTLEFGEDNIDTSDLVPWIEFHTSLLFRDLWGAPNQTLEWSYGTKFATSRILWGAPNQTLEWSYGAEHLGPFIRGQVPSTCGCCITTTAGVAFTVGAVLPRTVDTTTLVVTFVINGTPVTVYDGGAGGFQPGYTGTLTPAPTAFEDLWNFDVVPDAGFVASATVEVEVEVLDDLAVAMAPPASWCFCVFDAPPVPPMPPSFRVVPREFTIRGNVPLLIAGDDVLVDTSRDVNFTSTLGWTPTVSGSGSTTLSLGVGVVLDTGLTRLSVAGLESPDDYDHVDAEVWLSVPSTGLGQLAVLEADSSGALARVFVERSVSGVFARGEYDAGSGSAPIGTGTEGYVLEGAVRLRLVRNGSRVFGFVGIVQVLYLTNFPTAAGPLRIYAKNSAPARIRSRALSFEARPHVRVGERLLLDKVEVGTRRIVGLVPPATVNEVGPVDVTTFGTYGSSTLVGDVSYILPVPRTLTTQSRGTLITVQIPALKDGSDGGGDSGGEG